MSIERTGIGIPLPLAARDSSSLSCAENIKNITVSRLLQTVCFISHWSTGKLKRVALELSFEFQGTVTVVDEAKH